MTPRLEFAVRTAREAGDSTLRLFRAGREFDLKADATPVTAADVEAERIVRARISESYPGEHVLGEEMGGSAGPDDRWVVDPIDGTKSFITGVPLYGTLLSYEVDRNPVLGVAYFPAIGETVWAETGGGCFWNGNACRVKSNPDLELAVVCHGGLASMAQRGLLGGLERLSRTCLATRSWCDAYGHALVATGRADAMIDPKVSVWDVSALAVIVREAGGHFTDLEGSSGLSDSAISVSPSIGPALLQELRT